MARIELDCGIGAIINREDTGQLHHQDLDDVFRFDQPLLYTVRIAVGIHESAFRSPIFMRRGSNLSLIVNMLTACLHSQLTEHGCVVDEEDERDRINIRLQRGGYTNTVEYEVNQSDRRDVLSRMAVH